MNIQPGDVVLAAWHLKRYHGDWFDARADVLRTHVGRVRDICDHWSECAGVSKHEGTSILFEDGEQLPIQYCRILFRPFKSEVSA